MGVGTMIIFIAMILVAAVAASVLIGTANKVREQAQNTGDQAINNVASGFLVQDVTGTVNAAFTNITSLTIQMRLQAGSPSINMDQVTIRYVSGTTSEMLAFSETIATGDEDVNYAAKTTASDANTWKTDNHVVAQGDLITVTIDGIALGHTAAAALKIIPSYGTSTTVSFITPSLYYTKLVNLR